MSLPPAGERDRADRAAVWASARAHDLDRYLAALLAPRAARADLVALAAFLGEIGRIPMLVRDPLLAEIRLQWWREWLESAAPDTRAGNPLADVMADVVARRGLDRARLFEIIDAGSMLLEHDGIASPARLAAFLDAREVSATRLAARLLAPDASAWRDGLDAAARAYGVARLLCDLPRHRARGRTVPAADEMGQTRLEQECRRHLDVARRALAGAPREIVIAALPAALVEPYLRVLEDGAGEAPGAPRRDIQPLTRAWRLWQARWWGI